MSLDSKHAEARFSPNATDSLYLLVAQVPRPRDMVIFALTTTTRPITLPLAHARGVITDMQYHPTGKFRREKIDFATYHLYVLLLMRNLC